MSRDQHSLFAYNFLRMAKPLQSRKHRTTSARLTCAECGEVLVRGAQRCLKCGTYQNRWKSRLQFVTAVAGGLALIGGALVYSLKLWPTIRKDVSWKTEIRVVEFNSSERVTILNTGDGTVLLSHVTFDIEGIQTRTIMLNKLIKPLEMFQHNEPTRASSKPYYLLAHVSAAEWQAAIVAARNFDTSGCIYAAAFADTDPTYMMYADVSRRDPHHFPVLRAGASLHFYDPRKGSGEVKIPAHAYLFRRSDCSVMPILPK